MATAHHEPEVVFGCHEAGLHIVVRFQEGNDPVADTHAPSVGVTVIAENVNDQGVHHDISTLYPRSHHW